MKTLKFTTIAAAVLAASSFSQVATAEISANVAATSNYFASLAEIEQSEVMGISMVENEYVEYANVGAGVGGGFENTAELKPMKYEQAINGPEAEA